MELNFPQEAYWWWTGIWQNGLQVSSASDLPKWQPVSDPGTISTLTPHSSPWCVICEVSELEKNFKDHPANLSILLIRTLHSSVAESLNPKSNRESRAGLKGEKASLFSLPMQLIKQQNFSVDSGEVNVWGHIYFWYTCSGQCKAVWESEDWDSHGSLPLLPLPIHSPSHFHFFCLFLVPKPTNYFLSLLITHVLHSNSLIPFLHHFSVPTLSGSFSFTSLCCPFLGSPALPLCHLGSWKHTWLWW